MNTRLPLPQLIRSFKIDTYLLVEYLSGRTVGSPYTVSIRQIDGNHIQGVLLAYEDLVAIMEKMKETP